MKRTLGITGILILAGILPVQAQEPQVMSLKACVEYALTHHPSATVYANQALVAQSQNKEGLSAYLPQVNASASLDDNIKRQTTIIPAGAFGPTPTQVQFGNQYASTVTGQLDQVIYDQTLINSIKASKMNVGLAELNVEKNENNIIYTTASAYCQVLILQEQLKLIRENEAKIRQLTEVQQLQFEKGVLRESDYKRVIVNYNNVKSQMELTEMNLKVAMANLKNYMGMESDADIHVSDSIDFEHDVPMPSNDPFDITQKVDYQILETNILLQQIDLKRKRAQALPSVSAYARYGANAFGNEFNSTFDRWYDFSTVGVKVTVPIFSGLRRVSQIRQSELTLENAHENLVLNSRVYTLQLENAQTKLNSSYINLQSNKDNMDLASEVYEMTSLQYQKGAVSLSDFLNADYAKKEAQSNYINSLFNYLIARIDIEQSKGTIKEFVNTL